MAIVDNDLSMLMGLDRLLQAHGFVTQAHASAEDFLVAPDAAEADCLILDIHLDGISGLELRRRLLDCGSTLPVIFMTALDDEQTRNEAKAAGCIAYLTKPFASQLLFDAIGKATA